MMDVTSARIEQKGSTTGAASTLFPLPQPMTAASWARRFAIWACVAVGFYAMLKLDLPVMRWRYEHFPEGPEGLLKQLVGGLRGFAEPYLIVVTLIVISRLDKRWVAIVLTILGAELVAGGVYNGGKLFVDRYRPHKAIEHVAPLDELTQNRIWLGISEADSDNNLQSFPSGHTSSAFAFAMTLAWFYPRLRVPVWVLAIGCGISRVIDAVHWPTDVLAGACVGYCAAWMALRPYAWVLPVIYWRRLRKQSGRRTAPSST